MPSITLPPHAIHSYRWKADPKAGGDSVRSAAEGDTDVLLIDRLQTTLTTPAEHADAQTLLRAARLQTRAPPLLAGRRKYPGEVDPGGELALLSADKRQATVTATMDTTVLMIDRGAFERVLGSLKGLQDASTQNRQ